MDCFCLVRLAAAALLLCLVSAAAFALNFPPLTGRVVDQANIMSAQSRSDLETKLKDLEDKSGIQLVVATVNSPSLMIANLHAFFGVASFIAKPGEAIRRYSWSLYIPSSREGRGPGRPARLAKATEGGLCMAHGYFRCTMQHGDGLSPA